MTETIIRAYRYALDPTPAQTEILHRYATASRCGFNFALGMKVAAYERWRADRNHLMAQGMNKAQATKKAPKVAMPNRNQTQADWRATRGQPFTGPLLPGQERPMPFAWWEGVNNRAYYTAFEDADTAWKNWLDSLAGRRPPMGFPRFKRRGRTRESFRIVHSLAKPDIRFEGPRRLRIPGGGGQPAFTVRLHQSPRDLTRLITTGQAVITSMTVARDGHRWHASVLARIEEELPTRPTRRQQAAGRVGVDLGVKSALVLSDPLTLHARQAPTLTLDNPRLLANTARKLARAQRTMARRFVKGAPQQSQGYQEARSKVAKLHAQLAARRATTQHLITKRLVQSYAEIALETLNTKGMTRSAKGTADKPGRNVRQKAGLNKAILDIGFAEIHRQIEYKARWHAVTLAHVPTFFPSSKSCHQCGWIHTGQTLKDREFHCEACGMIMDRDANAAHNIKKHAQPDQPQRPVQSPGAGAATPVDCM
ncbi:RNA-guided endonuclease InsQ/TnpB family protein [Streptomyces sp. NPDC051561]|uniref:RNA-guided endonuclease InsQ/TnpB family protein n=1 Tax=Streptomyces sp. NPDC051561 TaxID=3365658 RepID=UPI003791CD01